MSVFDDRVCALGEGPLWHPLRKQLFWFDILGKRLLSREGEEQLEWAFDEHVSAAGWVDENTLLIASESNLSSFDLETGESTYLAPLEVDRPETRSNDGRADPQGGFWIGTMGKSAEPGAGSIYRFYEGEVTKLFGNITISNSISFMPDGKTAFYTDSVKSRVLRVALDRDGWPKGSPELHIDLRAEGLTPDGAVCDAEGNLWIAQWGASRVACHGPDGAFLRAISFPATQVSCPAFGGDDLRRLFVTTAADGLEDDPAAGLTYSELAPSPGLPESSVHL